MKPTLIATAQDYPVVTSEQSMRFAKLAGLAFATVLATAGAAPAPDWNGAKTIVVRLANFSFTPSALELRRGTPYRLHLANTASGGHDFTAPQFFAAVEIATGDQGKIESGRVKLEGGESIDIHLVPLKAGIYPLHCSHFMHTTFGMKGTITVR
jgi:uncharacterized cupredoxin-like copper-binding protein